MAKDEKSTKKPQLPGGLKVAPAGILEELSSASQEEAEEREPRREGSDEGEAPAHLGATKYVHAAFFGGGILTAYLSGKILAMVWNRLAEWPAAVRTVPQLLRFAEDERNTITMLVGAVIGLIVVIQTYRKAHIRQFADEVAIELSKVTWPDKETVTNGTIVVVVASAVAAIYIALLDKLWGFLTALIYQV
jgi:preprotein translocase subunit SecE